MIQQDQSRNSSEGFQKLIGMGTPSFFFFFSLSEFCEDCLILFSRFLLRLPKANTVHSYFNNDETTAFNPVHKKNQRKVCPIFLIFGPSIPS